MESRTRHAHRERIAASLDHVQDNLGADLRLDVLAKRAGVSPFHFHRLFREQVGEPPSAYVRRLRLERAALLLWLTGHPVRRVALESGYETQEAFTRAFRTRFGVPPCRFRDGTGAMSGPENLRTSVVRIPSRPIAFVRKVGPYDDVPCAFDTLRSWAESRGIFRDSSTLSVYWDDQRITASEHTRCDAALLLHQDVDPEGEVRVGELQGGEYVVATLPGAYDKRAIRRVYDFVYRTWVHAAGREPASAPPFEVRSSSDASTSVYVPLATERAA